MASSTEHETSLLVGGFVVPGTSVSPAAVGAAQGPGVGRVARDATLRRRYVEHALPAIPRLLGAIDRNPFRPTYGCLDRQHWHYRTSSFPSQMYQEGVLPLAILFSACVPGNRWYQNEQVRELAVAGIRFAAASAHADGSCDDYYPFERALGAAVFSLQAMAEAYRLLELDDDDILDFFVRQGQWVANHDESGRLANHEALAALALARVARTTCDGSFLHAANARVERVLDWQSDEGWFDEYGGADPGYQTVTIDALVKYRRLTGDERLDEPLGRAVRFARWFLHPDHSYGGPYGSRGTYHFYPHGMELLAAELPEAAELADGFLHSLAEGTDACFGDDRMYVHRLGNLLEAYLDWSPTAAIHNAPPPAVAVRHFSKAGILVCRRGREHTVVSTARGGTFKHFPRRGTPVVDAGLILQTIDGRVAVSQWHALGRDVACSLDGTSGDCHADEVTLTVAGELHWARFETISPWKQILLHLGMMTVGRWCRRWIRQRLQRRLIAAGSCCPIRLVRRVELLGRSVQADVLAAAGTAKGNGNGETKGTEGDSPIFAAQKLGQSPAQELGQSPASVLGGAEGDSPIFAAQKLGQSPAQKLGQSPAQKLGQSPALRVSDTIERVGPDVKVARMAFGTDHESAYVAASGVYQPSVLAPWTDLDEYVESLNRDGQVTIVREF